MLSGEKVTLRPVKQSDLPFFLKWFNETETTQYLSFYLPMTELAETEWIKRVSTSSTEIVFVIEANTSNGKENVPIGNCGLHRINFKDRSTEFGIAIGESAYWNNGLGTEAAYLILKYGFESINLHRIGSSAIAFNERSIRMHKKLGFVEEGRKRKAIFKNGKYHDMVIFGILAGELAKL